MKLLLDIKLPLQSISELNTQEHWTKSHKRHRIQKKCIMAALRNQMISPSKCHIKLTRISNRELDYVNLVSAFKWVQDQVADELRPGQAPGRADGDKSLTWEFLQEKTDLSNQGTRIQIFDSSTESSDS